MSLLNQMRDLFGHPDQLLDFARENCVQFGLIVPDLVAELIEQCDANVAGQLLMLATQQVNGVFSFSYLKTFLSNTLVQSQTKTTW